MSCVADLADALCIIVAGGNRCLKNLGADKKIVADFDGEKKARAYTIS